PLGCARLLALGDETDDDGGKRNQEAENLDPREDDQASETGDEGGQAQALLRAGGANGLRGVRSASGSRVTSARRGRRRLCGRRGVGHGAPYELMKTIQRSQWWHYPRGGVNPTAP